MFLKKIPKNKHKKPKTPIAKDTVGGKTKNKKKLWRILLIAIGVIIITAGALFAYIVAQGSRVFDPSIDPKQGLLKTLTNAEGSSLESLDGYKDGRINILFMGMGGSNHPGGQLTDSIMLVSINPTDHAMAMLSIPRDLYVPIADHKVSAKINEAFYYGEKDKKGGGPALAKKTISNVLGVPIQYYVTVDFEGFEKVIDEIGGVDVTVNKAIYDPKYPDDRMVGYSPFYIKEGQHHLDGKTALKYARSRETTSDFDRASRQQQIIGAVKEKVLTLGFLANPKKIFDMITIVGNHVRTDLSPDNMKALGEIFKNLDGSKTVSKVLTNASGGPLVSDSSTGTYYLYPRGGNFKLIQKITQNIFANAEYAKEDTTVSISYGPGMIAKAKEFEDSMRGFGYNVIMSQSGSDAEKSTIYDYTKGSDQSAVDFLKKKLSLPVVEKTPEKNSTIEITVVVGTDFQGFQDTGSGDQGQ